MTPTLAQTVAGHVYQRGLADGVAAILDMIEGRGDNAYQGPLPVELREWIDGARDVVALEQEHRS